MSGFYSASSDNALRSKLDQERRRRAALAREQRHYPEPDDAAAFRRPAPAPPAPRRTVAAGRPPAMTSQAVEGAAQRPSRVNPSAPVLARREQRDQRLQNAGVDPVLLRQELIRRRTTDAALLRQRQALGRQAQMLDAQGDRVGAEQVRAQIETLEGGRREAAGVTARSSALLRGGESRLPDDGVTIEQVRARQAIERQKKALEDQARDTGMAIAGRDLQARDLASQAGLSDAARGLTEADTNELRARLGFQGIDATSEDLLAKLQHQSRTERLLSRDAENAAGEAAVGGPARRALANETDDALLQQLQAERDLARLQARQEGQVAGTTFDSRASEAEDLALLRSLQARRDRERLEARDAGSDGRPILRELYGDDFGPAEQTSLITEVRGPVESLVSVFRERSGSQPTASEVVGPLETLVDFFDRRRASMSQADYDALRSYMKGELERALGSKLRESPPFGTAASRSGLAALALGTGSAQSPRAVNAWSRLRSELGL